MKLRAANYILQMKKQKQEVLPVCKCSEYQQQILKIRSKIVETLSITTKVDTYSAYRLIKMFVYAFNQRQKFIQHIESQLRIYSRKNSTIEYRQEMGIEEMINSLFGKIAKEKIIHHHVVEKEREIINRYVKQNRTAVQEIEYLKQLLIQEQREQQTWKNEALKQEKQNHSLKREVELKKEENRLLQDLTKKLQQKISSLQVRIVGLQADKSQLSKDFLLKSEQVAKLASNFKSFKGELSYNSKVQLNKKIEALKSEQSIQANPETAGNSMNKMNSTLFNDNYLYNHLFVGEVLLNEEESRRFLVQTLQRHNKNAIVRSKFIYKMDYYNTTNIHRYIDGLPHILFIIRTENGQIIAAYSQGAFKAKTLSNRDGLLINLNNRKVFTNSRKAIVYDEVEVIFGNFDLRLRVGDSKIFSNFASNNSFYDSQGQSVNGLIGEGKNRQAKLKNYQIFQAVFQ